MKNKIFLTSILFLILIQNVFAFEKQRDYEEQISFIKKLNKNFTCKIIQNIKVKDSDYPVYLISYNKTNNCMHKYLIICGVHGNEPAPVFAIKDFILKLNNQNIIRKELQIDFLYIVNPYGFEFNQRNNENNKDINRDLILLQTQEAKIITQNFKPKDYEKVFDCHEANSEGSFIYCYGNKNKKYTNGILNKLACSNVKLDNSYKDKILSAKNGLLYVPSYATAYMKIKKTITNGIYFKDCKNSLTFETSKNISLNERERIYSIILDYILEN